MTAHAETCELGNQECLEQCWCGRGWYPSCRYKGCYDCYLDRRSEFVTCVYCGKWHSPEFDTCFKCRPASFGRDEAAKALRQLVMWRDGYRCRYCGAREGELRVDPRRILPRCRRDCILEHQHRERDTDGLWVVQLHLDHIVPCAVGGNATEWNLQALCGVCNIAKGSTWYIGCRHDRAKTQLARRYRLMPDYFNSEGRAEFLAEWRAFRVAGTWDPRVLDEVDPADLEPRPHVHDKLDDWADQAEAHEREAAVQ